MFFYRYYFPCIAIQIKCNWCSYAEGLQQEFPRAHIERYALYCPSNQRFRLFRVEG